MSTFDDLIYGAKKALDVATVKTNELYEASKIQIEKSQLNGKMKEEYLKLGKTCYQMSDTGIDQTEKMKTIITKIHELDAELKNLNQNSETSKYKTCSECNSQNSIKSNFCYKCGNKL